MNVFNQNDLLNYELKYKDDKLVLDLVAALRHCYEQIAAYEITNAGERIADLQDENNHLQDKIINMGAMLKKRGNKLKVLVLMLRMQTRNCGVIARQK